MLTCPRQRVVLLLTGRGTKALPSSEQACEAPTAREDAGIAQLTAPIAQARHAPPARVARHLPGRYARIVTNAWIASTYLPSAPLPGSTPCSLRPTAPS